MESAPRTMIPGIATRFMGGVDTCSPDGSRGEPGGRRTTTRLRPPAPVAGSDHGGSAGAVRRALCRHVRRVRGQLAVPAALPGVARAHPGTDRALLRSRHHGTAAL